MFWSGWFDKSDEALEVAREWIRMISEQRQSREEWTELLQMVSNDEYELRKHPRKNNLCLIGSRLHKKKKRVVFEPRYLMDNDELPMNLPAYLIPLYGLKLSFPYEKKRDLCISQGGIAGLIHMEEGPLDHMMRGSRWLARGTGVEHAFDLEIGDDVAFFQSGSTGRIFFINGDQRILVYSREAGRLKDIGTMNNFVRYCLYYLVQGLDWYSDGYGMNKDTEYFDIQYYD